MSTLLQSTTFFISFLSIRSSQMRMLLPFPSRKGWAIFISTYFSIICSNPDCGILSIFLRASAKYMTGAKRKFPFAIFTVLISPAKSYISSKRNLWISESDSKVPASSLSRRPLSNSSMAFCLLILSSAWASSKESEMPNLFWIVISFPCQIYLSL